VPIQTVAHALPFVNWITLVALAGGTFGFVALAGQFTDATRGYLAFTAVCAALLAGLALLADISLPPTDANMAIVSASPDLETLRRAALGVFALVGVLYAVALARGWRRSVLAAAGIAAFAVALTAAAVGWAATGADAVPFLLQLAVLSAAAGGSLAALVLGHWYLVTPRISTRPLVLLTRALAMVVLVQLLLFAVWALFGGGPGQAAFESLTGSAALFGWLRLLVSLVFPLVLIVMARRTAQTRSMESATGLLYIAIAAIAAGTIGAAALYVTRGILV
jgi:hypothetical protein